jgi:hypothetical protein
MPETLDTLSAKLDALGKSIDKRFEQVDNRFEQVDKRFDEMESRLGVKIEAVDVKASFSIERLDDLRSCTRQIRLLTSASENG